MSLPPPEDAARFELLYAQPVVAEQAFNSQQEAAQRVSTAPCPVCGETSARSIFSLPGTRFETIRCQTCGLGSLHPPPTPEEVASFYPPTYYGSDGQKFSGGVEALVRLVGARHSQFLCRRMKPGGRILDVGCGRGFTLRALADAGFETYGFEVSADAAKGLDSRVKLRLAESLVQAEYPSHYFDGILIWHVLEHVRQPRSTVAELYRILKPGGTLVVAVPNFSSWQARWAGPDWFHLDPPRHLFHFPIKGLRQLLESERFQVLGEHHFSLRQNPFGWIQSALNKCRWLPRNGLYMLLHSAGAAPVNYPRMTKFQLYLGGFLLAPWALLLSVLAAIFRQGATVHLVVQKPGEGASDPVYVNQLPRVCTAENFP